MKTAISMAVDEIWNQYDKDGNGTLDHNEAKEFVKKTLGDNCDLDHIDS